MFNVDSGTVATDIVVLEKNESRNGRWFQLPLGCLLLFLYAYLYSADVGYVYIVNSVLLLLLALVFCLYHRPGEILNPAKLFTVLYGASFAFLPFWLVSLGGYYYFRYLKSMVPELMDKGASMALLGYVFFLCGYFIALKLFTGGRFDKNNVDKSVFYATFIYCVFLSLGFLCFLVIFIQLGGFQHFAKFDQGRAELLVGVYGGYFWGMHLLIPGFCVFCVLYIKRFPVVCLILAVLIAMLFSVLQGRDMVVAPFFCWLVLFDGYRKSIKFKVILIFSLVLVIISSLVGAVRAGGVGDGLLEFSRLFLDNALYHFSKLLAANIEQLDTAMAAIKHADADGRVGIMVLMTWFEPIDRALFGNSVNSINSGVLIDLLLIPEHKGWNTAASPSIIGELYLAFKWVGVAFGLFLVGCFFALLSHWYDSRRNNSLLFSAYPFVLYVFTKMIVDGLQHGFRAMLVFSSVLLFFMLNPSAKRIHDE